MAKKTLLMVMNWKMHPESAEDARALLLATEKTVAKQCKTIVAPPAIFLADLSKKVKKSIAAAQNVHWEKSGSYTGEISVPMVKDAGVTHVIIGHAERRAMGDTDEDVSKKVASAIGAGLTVVACIGENKRDANGEYLHFIERQLGAILESVPKTKRTKLIIAYEPVWAIGADKPMSSHEMHQMSVFIRKTLVAHFGNAALNSPVLYGGSIDPENMAEMLENGDVDGLLVGRAGLSEDPLKAFAEVLKSI